MPPMMNSQPGKRFYAEQRLQAASELMRSISQMLLPKLEFHDKRTPKRLSDRAMKGL